MPMHGSFLFSGVSNTKFCVNILATIVDLVIFATESNIKMSVEQMFIVVQLGQSIYCKPNRAVARKKTIGEVISMAKFSYVFRMFMTDWGKCLGLPVTNHGPVTKEKTYV